MARLDTRRARFVALASPKLDRAYRLAGLLLGNASEAEEAVQEALATAWRSFGSLRALVDPASILQFRA